MVVGRYPLNEQNLPDEDMRVCSYCHRNCYISVTLCACKPTQVACLRDYKHLCKCPPDKKVRWHPWCSLVRRAAVAQTQGIAIDGPLRAPISFVCVRCVVGVPQVVAHWHQISNLRRTIAGRSCQMYGRCIL